MLSVCSLKTGWVIIHNYLQWQIIILVCIIIQIVSLYLEYDTLPF